MPKLIVLLRIKNGMFFLPAWLACYEKIADEIVVLDNDSTDGTLEMLSRHDKVTEVVQTRGFNEGRDKRLMYEAARRRHPDWCIWVDVDELFEPQVTRQSLNKLMRWSFINKFGFRRFHFIDNEHFAGSWFRLNYTAGHDRVMWREASTGYFQDVIIDSPNVKGIRGIIWPTNFRLKHTGYINRAIVDQKADLYRSIIPEKKETFKKMYLENERKVRWNDNRNHLPVRALNILLDLLQIKHLIRRVFLKGIGIARRTASKNIKPRHLPTVNQMAETE